MIATLLSLVAAALLSLVLLSTTFHSGDGSSTNVSRSPGVAQADDLVAQQALSTALTSVGTAAANAGGYGALDVATLSASDPTVSYVAGPTTSASTVSIAVTGGAVRQLGRCRGARRGRRRSHQRRRRRYRW